MSLRFHLVCISPPFTGSMGRDFGLGLRVESASCAQVFFFLLLLWGRLVHHSCLEGNGVHRHSFTSRVTQEVRLTSS